VDRTGRALAGLLEVGTATKGDAMTDYNYHAFTPEHVTQGMDEFRHVLHVGDRVPDFSALTPEGETIHLSEHLRHGDFTILEFGSLT
jgi:hypothetical protein